MAELEQAYTQALEQKASFVALPSNLKINVAKRPPVDQAVFDAIDEFARARLAEEKQMVEGAIHEISGSFLESKGTGNLNLKLTTSGPAYPTVAQLVEEMLGRHLLAQKALREKIVSLRAQLHTSFLERSGDDQTYVLNVFPPTENTQDILDSLRALGHRAHGLFAEEEAKFNHAGFLAAGPGAGGMYSRITQAPMVWLDVEGSRAGFLAQGAGAPHSEINFAFEELPGGSSFATAVNAIDAQDSGNAQAEVTLLAKGTAFRLL